MAALVAKDIISRALTHLQDPDGTRWSYEELADALNDAVLEMCLLKPSAFAESVVIDLQAGTHQALPAGYAQLMRVVRNITSASGVTPRIGGPVITEVDKSAMDQQVPRWHMAGVVPHAATVQHVIYDAMNPLEFYVFPGNDGNGRVEVVAAVEPELVSIPADPTELADYTDTIDVAPIYKSALVDYLLYMAYVKDSQIAGSAQRSLAFYRSFQTKLGARNTIEATAAPETE